MELFGLDKVSKHDENTELLVTVYDNGTLAVVRSILEGEKIPYVIKERGAGSSVKIIAGYSMYGSDIFVRKEDLEAASELIHVSDSGTEENDADDNGNGNDDNSNGN